MPKSELEASASPYSGANIFGAAMAGRGTPVGSGLTPAGTRWAELQYMKTLTDYALASNELKLRGVTAYSNMIVARVQERRSILDASINAMRIGQQENQRITAFYIEQQRLDGLTRVAAPGGDVDEATYSRLAESVTAVREGAVNNIEDIIGPYRAGHRNIEQTKQAMINATVKDINLSVIANSKSAMNALYESGAPATRIVDTKNQAKSLLLKSAKRAFDEYMKSLDIRDPKLRDLKLALSAENAREDFVRLAAKGAILGNEDLYEPSYAEEAKARQLRLDADTERKIVKEKVESMAVGISPELQEAVGESIRAGDALIAGGIEGFLEEAGKVQDPVSLQIAKQEALASLEEIKNPTDPLSKVVNEYAAAIPHFDSYMAAMGFNDVYKAIDYFDKHKETEGREYLNIVKMMYENEDQDKLEDVGMLRERLRVAGSSGERGTTGPFKKGFLTKPIERLFGVGVNRPPMWKYFSGTNSMEQLDNAVRALESEVSDADAAETDSAIAARHAAEVERLFKETEGVSDEGMDEATRGREEADADLREEVELREWAKGFSPKERERLIKKAEKYAGRIDPARKIGFEEREEAHKKRTGRERQVLPGFKAAPVEPQPVAVEAEQVQEEPRSRRAFRLGGRREGTSAEEQKLQADALAALAAGKAPADALDLVSEDPPVDYPESQQEGPLAQSSTTPRPPATPQTPQSEIVPPPQEEGWTGTLEQIKKGSKVPTEETDTEPDLLVGDFGVWEADPHIPSVEADPVIIEKVDKEIANVIDEPVSKAGFTPLKGLGRGLAALVPGGRQAPVDRVPVGGISEGAYNTLNEEGRKYYKKGKPRDRADYVPSGYVSE